MMKKQVLDKSDLNRYVILVLSGLAVMTGSLLSDTYVPALPEIARYFHASTGAIQNTITFYLIGFAFSQLIYGICVDRFGRRINLLVGLGIAFFASLGCLLSHSMLWFSLFRLMQGIGTGAGIVVGRTISRDLFRGKKLAEVISYMSIMFVLAPTFAPVIGGYIQTWLGWHYIFIFIVSYIGLLVLLVAWLLPETMTQKQTYHGGRQILKDYSSIIRRTTFACCAYCSTVAVAGLMAYYTVSSFIFENILGMTPVHYSWLAVIVGIFAILSRVLSGVLVRRFSSIQVMQYGVASLLLAGSLMTIGFMLHLLAVFTVLIPVVIYTMGSGLIFANAYAIAMDDFSQSAGTAASIYGFIQMGGSFLVTYMLSCFKTVNQGSLALTLLLLGLSAFMVHRIGLRAGLDKQASISP